MSGRAGAESTQALAPTCISPPPLIVLWSFFAGWVYKLGIDVDNDPLSSQAPGVGRDDV